MGWNVEGEGCARVRSVYHFAYGEEKVGMVSCLGSSGTTDMKEFESEVGKTVR